VACHFRPREILWTFLCFLQLLDFEVESKRIMGFFQKKIFNTLHYYKEFFLNCYSERSYCKNSFTTTFYNQYHMRSRLRITEVFTFTLVFDPRGKLVSEIERLILLHIRFPWWHDLCTLLHFHSNVTVLLHNKEFVAFPW
jgi:hypothetical protein